MVFVSFLLRDLNKSITSTRFVAYNGRMANKDTKEKLVLFTMKNEVFSTDVSIINSI